MSDRRYSTGQLISTLCFLGVGFWLMSQALEAPFPRSLALWITSLCCFAGSARNVIARFWVRR